MIKVDETIVNQGHFPDGSLLVKQDKKFFYIPTITWHYESDAELFTIICLKKHLSKADLVLPYVPHARMDRVKNEDEVFTLKYFCEAINNLNFNSVTILDPHSNVAPALLDRVKVITSESYVEQAIEKMEDKENLVLFTPDEGAMKRYSEYEIFKTYPSTFGMKNRDWKSGKILSYEILHPEVIKDKNILIVDDICSYGGTFYHAAKALKAAGAKNIYLAVTHAENSMVLGDMYNTDGLIETIYTTNSIFNPALDCHNKVVTMLI